MYFALVIEAYGCGCLPRRAMMMRCLLTPVEGEGEADVDDSMRAWARDVWQTVEARVAAHGDATPRVMNVEIPDSQIGR